MAENQIRPAVVDAIERSLAQFGELYKSFAENSEFWEDKIIPLMQKKIDVNWAYSSEQDTEIKKMEAEASDEGGEDNE